MLLFYDASVGFERGRRVGWAPLLDTDPFNFLVAGHRGGQHAYVLVDFFVFLRLDVAVLTPEVVFLGG